MEGIIESTMERIIQCIVEHMIESTIEHIVQCITIVSPVRSDLQENLHHSKENNGGQSCHKHRDQAILEYYGGIIGERAFVLG